MLNRAINFARTKCDISDHEIDIILHCRKIFLFNNGNPWIKKGEKENFDVPMGSYDGAELCELVGLYLLHLMTTGKNPVYNEVNVGLYCDDCLAVINSSARTIETKVRKLFKNENLNIIVEPSAHVTNFLDVDLNLTTGKHKP